MYNTKKQLIASTRTKKTKGSGNLGHLHGHTCNIGIDSSL